MSEMGCVFCCYGLILIYTYKHVYSCMDKLLWSIQKMGCVIHKIKWGVFFVVTVWILSIGALFFLSRLSNAYKQSSTVTYFTNRINTLRGRSQPTEAAAAAEPGPLNLLGVHDGAITLRYQFPTDIEKHTSIQAISLSTRNLVLVSIMHFIVVGSKEKLKTVDIGFVILNMIATTIMAYLALYVKWVAGIVALEWFLTVVAIIFWFRFTNWYNQNPPIISITNWVNALRGRGQGQCQVERDVEMLTRG